MRASDPSGAAMRHARSRALRCVCRQAPASARAPRAPLRAPHGGASIPGQPRGQRTPRTARAHAAAIDGTAGLLEQDPEIRGYAARASIPSRALPPLPHPPKSAEIYRVLPYLVKIATDVPGVKLRLLGSLCLMMLAKVSGLAVPVLFKKAVDILSANPAGATPEAIIAAACGALVLSGALKALSGAAKEAQAVLFTPVAQAASRRVAFNTFRHILNMDAPFHLNRQSGTLNRMLERGTRSVYIIFRAVVFTFIPTLVELAMVCALLWHQFTPAVSGAVMLTFLVYCGFTIAMTSEAARVRKIVNRIENYTNGKAVDALLNFETVTLFNNEELEGERYDSHLRAYHSANIDAETVSCALNAGQAIILAAGITGVLVLIAQGGVGAMTAGDMVMANGLILQLWAPLGFLGWFYRELRQSLVDMDNFFTVMSMKPSVKDGSRDLPNADGEDAAAGGARPRKLAGVVPGDGEAVTYNFASVDGDEEPLAAAATGNGASNGATSTANGAGESNGLIGVLEDGDTITYRFQHAGPKPSAAAADPSASSPMPALAASARPGLALRMRDVKFAYVPERQILRGVSLDVAPGQSIAVVGASGSGKSTLLRLVLRLWDASDGAIELDGVEVKDIKTSSLRNAVAVVPQDTVLFNDSILNNIRYGRPSATDQECIAAARAAEVHDTVLRMPQGYATVVGERGLKLSGGEKQRIAIARAFLRDPRLLVCDEATSALDSTTEASIMASLTALSRGRTAVFVTHRLTTTRHCDRIFVMEHGRVVESGTHDELMEKDGVYKHMWDTQQAERTLIEQNADELAFAHN
ncbi:unnamed protein product [Pedinophyceae sp. YPF-701]|nr:unnamed protein product [Pedinophyceae sp. YPF-701]